MSDNIERTDSGRLERRMGEVAALLREDALHAALDCFARADAGSPEEDRYDRLCDRLTAAATLDTLAGVLAEPEPEAIAHLRRQLEWYESRDMERFGLPFGTMLNAQQIREILDDRARLTSQRPEEPATCGCVSVDFGSYDNVVVLWPPPSFGFTRVPLGIDRCIALEILDLWRAGIKTVASCCGHNKAPAIISVFTEHDQQMRDLGYVPCPDKPATFYAKSVATDLSSPSSGAGE